MRLPVKIITWSFAVIASLAIILFSISIVLGDKVAEIFLKSINDQVATRIEVGEYNLSLLKRFPKAAVELKDVIVWSSPTYNKKHFGKTNTDTLLSATAVFLEFSMTDIIKEIYNIERITVEDGRLNIFSDSSGNVNYEIAKNTSSGSDEEFVINLERINASSVTTRYLNKATDIDISGVITTGSFKSRIAGDVIDFTCNSDLVIRHIDILSTPLTTNAAVTIDLNLHQSDSGLVFRKGLMKLESFRFGLTGTIDSADVMDLRITGEDIDLAKVKKYFPEAFLEKYNEYSPSGILKSECRISGLLSMKQNPSIKLLFSIEKGSIRYVRSDIGIKGLSLSGSISNGSKRNAETWIIDLNKAGFTIGTTQWSGALKVMNMNNPRVELTFSGEIRPDELLSFFPVPEIMSASGSLRLNMNLSGKPGNIKNFSFSDIIGLNPEADISFNSFYLNHKNDRWSVDDVDGNIMVAKNVWAEELLFSYREQRFRVNGEFINLPEWLAGRRVKLKAYADISAGSFDPVILLGDTTAAGERAKTAFSFPNDIEARIRFSTDNLVYKSFRAEKVSGLLSFNRGVLDLSELNINAVGGVARGEFFIAQTRKKSFLSHGKFTFENIDINQTFKTFRNFGQDFLKAENIEGSLSGNLTLTMPLDSVLNPDIKAITAEGKYIIENGTLRNFEPVKALSGFIELSELETITFSRLENDLFIRNNYLAVPQMDIRSSAADFSVNGKHSFDLSYEYHVKVYLSELLSKKARNNSRYSTEFGPVEEDGLGRTSIFLKLTGNADNLKVTPDMKATRNNIKQSLNKEKVTLKSILNEEYGWYKNDTTVKAGTGSKPKFRIQFEETDSTSVDKDTVSAEENRGINRIFKKKKGTDLIL